MKAASWRSKVWKVSPSLNFRRDFFFFFPSPQLPTVLLYMQGIRFIQRQVSSISKASSDSDCIPGEVFASWGWSAALPARSTASPRCRSRAQRLRSCCAASRSSQNRSGSLFATWEDPRFNPSLLRALYEHRFWKVFQLINCIQRAYLKPHQILNYIDYD